MKYLGLFIITVIFIIGTSHVAYCPGPGSYGSGSYKGGGSYPGSGDYKDSGGDQVKTDKPTYSPTLGQELIDLKKAYKKGIINEQEYNDLKKMIIEQWTKKDK